MTPEDWQRLKPLFDRAVELPAADQAALVEELRRQDRELANRLAALLGAHAQNTEPVEQPLFRFDADFSAEKTLFTPGELILDRFRILRFLGRGGMGEVYEADDLELGRVALKTIRPVIAGDPQMLLRFKQEVQLARRITSPYVCRIHELHTLPRAGLREPSVFLTMEFLEGATLSSAIAQAGVLPLDQAQIIALQLCAALQAVHDAGVIHRDFKSNNVMLVPCQEQRGAPQAVLMDLGLARETIRADAAAAGSAITMPGAIMGTSEYMAPEQFEDQPVTPAADIYALGVVLYELATGARPFHASTPLAAAVRRARRLPPATTLRADLPPHWDAVIARCLEYDPEKRYASATDVAAALQPTPTHITLRLRLAILTAIVVVAAALAALYWYRSRAYPPPAPAVQKWYRDGVAALREGSYLKATRALERAVKLDPTYALAHVRLADAWAELDFTGKAQQEMLEASGLDSARLPITDKQYLDAVRHTLTGQFADAVRDYSAILRELPSEEKPYGLVDLGRAHEKAGQITEAQQDYTQAAAFPSEDPAPFVHLAIIEARAGQKTEADAAFDRAENLYRSASDTEGLAEIAYQRGIAARSQGDYPKARTLLAQCLNAARDLDSPQLQIRTLTQLGAVEYVVDNRAKALELYGQAIDLARARGLSTWATEGVIRSGLVYIDEQDLTKAAAIIQQGLQQAEELQSPRLEALARVSLASVRDQQSGPPAERLALAQQAYDYYKTTGFLGQTNSALTLLVRALGDQGNYALALQYSLQNIQTARKMASAVHILQAEESAGGLGLKLQHYPEALTHFQTALATARQIHQFIAYEASNCANALWHLGRYSEARQMLATIPPAEKQTREITVLLTRINAAVALSERRFQEALTLAQHLLKASTQLTPAETMELDIVSGLAQSELGAASQARQSCQAALDLAGKQNDRYQTAEAQVCAASAALSARSAAEARPLAETAQQYFAASQQKESEWQSLLILSQACDQSGDSDSAKKYAQKALDIFTNLENNWGNATYQSYVSRPDIQQARQELLKLVRK